MELVNFRLQSYYKMLRNRTIKENFYWKNLKMIVTLELGAGVDRFEVVKKKVLQCIN